MKAIFIYSRMHKLHHLKKFFFAGLFLMTYGVIVHAQLFPGLTGEELATAIRDQYSPTQLLNFTQVKDTLYAKIFFKDDSVRCIYSNLAHDLPAGVDPSQWVFGSGNEVNSINLEHGWPQAKGAGDGTNGQMNMYNLFPSRVAINGDRADFPYHEVNDNETQKWYYLEQELHTKPTSNIDAYSEFGSGLFEPRESVKGDIARAMFYFWTIYRDDAVAADPAYFEEQRESLCAWHEEDPVDDEEAFRNQKIALYQGGIENPFITDCTLADRAYCPNNVECDMVNISEAIPKDNVIIFDPALRRLIMNTDVDREWQVKILAMTGQHIYETVVRSRQWTSSIPLSTGMYIAYVYCQDGRAVKTVFVP